MIHRLKEKLEALLPTLNNESEKRNISLCPGYDEYPISRLLWTAASKAGLPAEAASQAAEEAFVAEVIPDNEEVNITPEEGEEVIEYTLNTVDAIPIGAIAVATFAIFLALIFFYN